jgi:predicted dehydrogenase
VLGERHGFELATTSFEEVIRDPTVDAVFIATPHHLHASQALEALQHGKHVFVEKPLATTVDDLRRICDMVLSESVPIWTVGFNRRFSRAARIATDCLADVQEPLTLSYRFNAGPLPRDHWAHDPSVGGGRLIGEACHALDLAAFLLKAEIVRVFAEAPVIPGTGGSGDDQASIVARFDNGSVASISYFAGGNKAFPKERIEIFGGGRVVVIDDFSSVALSSGGRTRRRRLFGRDKGHAAAIERFLASIRGNEPPPVPYSALLNVSWASILVVESLKAGLPIDVPTFQLREEGSL